MLYNKKAFVSAAALVGTSFAQDSTTGSGDASSTGSSASAGAACTVSYARILAGAPTPSGELLAAITSYASSAASTVTAASATGGYGAYGNPDQFLSQACDFSSQLPSSLQTQFDDYASSVISYVSASSSQIDDVITSCVATGSEGAGYTSFVNSLATHSGPLCTGSATGSQSSTGTGTDSSSATATSTDGGAGGAGGGTQTTGGGGDAGGSTTAPTGAATVPTAAFGGAVAAAAGVLGAAILL